MRAQKEEGTASKSKKTGAKQMSKMGLEQVVGGQISFFSCKEQIKKLRHLLS